MPKTKTEAAPTSPADESDPLAHARRLTEGMDSAVRIPGTQMRVGLDALLGLVPGIGDLGGAVISVYLVILAARLRVPRATIFRMLVNIGIDAVFGVIPLVGDLFDAVYKANTRNFRLIEKHVAPEPEPAGWSWSGIVLLVIGIAGMFAISVALTSAILSWLAASN